MPHKNWHCGPQATQRFRFENHALQNCPKVTGSKLIFLKIIPGVILFLAAAVASTYFYFTQKITITALASSFPGVIYTCSTIVFFFLAKKTRISNPLLKIFHLLLYCCLMIITYYVIWILTIYTSYLAFILGMLTAGAGSLITFMLADKFLAKIPFNKKHVFIAGGLSFLVTDIFLFSFNAIFDKGPIQYIFKQSSSTDTIYGEAIFFWQLFVGTKLVLTFQKAADK